MHIVDDQVETIHVYMVREEEKQPPLLLPLCAALVCLAVIAGVTMYSGSHPAYEHQTLTVPAHFLPPQTFTAAQAIIPTGIKTYPATTAGGTLTITNGSVIAQTLPAHLILLSNTGIQVVTDTAVYIPAGSADGYGVATVEAHAVVSGKYGNIPPLGVDRVEDTSLYIRNLSAFSGGKDGYTVNFVTPHDKEIALMKSRDLLASSVTGLHYPCSEQVSGAIIVTWHCRFVTYTVPSYMHVSAVQLVGTHVILSVWYLPPVRPVRMK
jgi:hypothetical protein